MENISTSIFKIHGAAISRIMLTLYGKTWITVAVCLLLPMILLGIFFDVRWVIVSLMVIFIVFPMLLAFLFFYYGINRVSVVNSTHHSLEFNCDGITACIYNKDDTATLQRQKSDKTHVKEPDASDFKEMESLYKLRSQTRLDCSSISSYVVGVKDVILHTSLQGKGFLIIPLSAFPDETSFARAMEMVSAGINKNN